MVKRFSINTRWTWGWITPRSGIRQLETTPIPQSLPKWFRLSSPKPAQLRDLPHPFLPATTMIKSCAHAFPSLLLPHDLPSCFPMWPCEVWHAPFFWELWVTNYLFNGTCLLICRPYHLWIKTILGIFLNNEKQDKFVFRSLQLMAGSSWAGISAI